MPPYEWPTKTVGPFCRESIRRVTATSSAREVSGICAAVTRKPVSRKRGITPRQLEPSAQAPCTSTTFILVGILVRHSCLGWENQQRRASIRSTFGPVGRHASILAPLNQLVGIESVLE